MKPGRELDALIAEEVMGWRIFPDGPNGEMHTIDANQCECHEYDIPHYSTDIAAAWKVVEKLSQIGSVFKDENPFWGCALASGEIIQGVSAPHAICLASLKAVEE